MNERRPARAVADKRTAARLRRRLVADLRHSGCLHSDRVAGALGNVPRELFVGDIAAGQGLEAVYRNEPLPAKIDGRGRWLSSSSQPSIMALMLEQLEVAPGQRVLEIGAGTGYNAALLRQLVGPAGTVTTIDIDPELARRARRALRQGGYRARVVVGDGRDGFTDGSPYDRIIVTASVEEIPNAWLDQLGPGGRLQLPLRLDSAALGQVIPVLELRDDHAESVAMTWGGFMPLHGGDGGQGPSPALEASEWTTGAYHPLVRITGPAPARLSEAARRRLLALVLEGPRSREPGGRLVTHWPAPPSLLLHLLMRVPATRRIELYRDGRQALGLMSPDGRDIAVASVPVRRMIRDSGLDARRHSRRDSWRIDTFGGAAMVGELEQIVEEWRALTRSGRTRLQIEARRSSAGSSADLRLVWEPRRRS